MSDLLCQLHPDERKPYKLTLAKHPLVCCSYSLDEPVPPCVVGHRGPPVEVMFRGKLCVFFRCYDGRLSCLPEGEYIEE